MINWRGLLLSTQEYMSALINARPGKSVSFAFYFSKHYLLCMHILYSTELEELGVLSSRVICFPFDRLEKTE